MQVLTSTVESTWKMAHLCLRKDIFLVDLRDFQLLGTHHLEIPSSANSIIDFQHILQTSFLAKICCVHKYMKFPP